MQRFFNTTGPCNPRRHYMLPPMERLPDIQAMFDREHNFVIHGPRQTGKTTAMRAIAEALRERGFAACWATLETSRGISDVASAEPLWLDALHYASRDMPEVWQAPDPAPFSAGPPGQQLLAFLSAWSTSLPVPLYCSSMRPTS